MQRTELDKRHRLNQAVPWDRRVLVDYGLFYSFSYLTLDDIDGDSSHLLQHDAIGYARINIDDAHEFFFRGDLEYRDYGENNVFSDEDHEFEGEVERAFYRFDLRRHRIARGDDPGTFGLSFQGGRDLVYWANGLVLGRTLDSAQLVLQKEPFELKFLAGITPRDTVDFDPSRPSFDDDTRRGFYGVMASATIDRHQPFVYFLAQRDYNKKDSDLRGIIPTDYEYNSYYVGAGSSGSFSDSLRYGVEAVAEFGDTLSNSFLVNGDALIPIFQDRNSIRAWAVNARLERVIESPYRPRLSTELTYASGDTDRIRTNSTFGGNAPGTVDRAFNSFGLTNTGLAFAPAVSNLVSFRVGGNVIPFPREVPRLQVGTDLFLLAKARPEAPIDEFSTDTRYLGWEPDLYLNWQVASDITLALRYGAFFPNEDAFESDEVRQFFFGSVTFAF